MRTAVSPQMLSATADRLAAPLAFILVGLPVFLLHWRYVQRTAAQNAEEAVSRIRAVFFYLALAATLLPAAQNALAFASRTLTQAFGLEGSNALLGSGQTPADNLIAVIVNLTLAAYFYRRNRQNWTGEICEELAEEERDLLTENYADARRLYRHVWLAYSLALTVFGVRQLLAYLLLSPQSFGVPMASWLANGLALLVVGVPLWVYTQRLIAQSLTERSEMFSWMRLGFLFVLTWLSLFVTLYQLGKIAEILLRLGLGEGMGMAKFLQLVRPAVAVLIPAGVVWAFYGRQRQEAVQGREPPPLRSALWRFHATVVSSAALLAGILGSSRLLGFLLNLIFGSSSYFNEIGRNELSASLATLLIALPLWWYYWKPLQEEAAGEGEEGDHGRRSLVRRAMLYGWIFVGVVGTMFATGSFFFEIIRSLLGMPSENVALDSLLRLRLTLIFLAVLLYHLLTLRRDQRLAAASLAARQADFTVAIWVEKDSRQAQELKAALQREAPHLPLIWLGGDGQPTLEQLRGAKALVISASVLESASADGLAVTKTFEGQRIVLPSPQTAWYWVGSSTQSAGALAKQTARALRLLAEGQPLPRQSDTAWLTPLAYLLAALFLLQFLAAILLSVITPLVD